MLLLYYVMTGKSINIGDIISRSILYCSTRTQGKLFYPSLIHQILVKESVEQYLEDEIVSEGGDIGTIDMKTVSRLRDKKEKVGGSVDSMGLM